jgi:hypothetical protein
MQLILLIEFSKRGGEKMEQQIQKSKKFVRIGFLCIILIAIAFAIVPYSIQPEIKGAPWGYPNLANPYVRETQSTRLSFTYFFYWYNWETSNSSIAANCTEAINYHPYNQSGVSYLDPNWDYREFQDMIQAGIDVFLPDYWGNNSWSIEGLPVMQQALDRLKSENVNANNIRKVENPLPKVGLFFDTTCMELKFHTLDNQENMITTADLTNQTCVDWFYGLIHDFYEQFEPWSIQQIKSADNPNSPTAYIVWLYGANYFLHTSQAALDYCKTRFLNDFNHTLLFIGTPDWVDGCPQIDGIYHWGSVIDGFTEYSDSPIKVASIGAGMNNGNATNGAVCSAKEPVIHTPRSPAYYTDNWTTVIKNNPNWVVVETWNELFEGTGICRTIEFNDTYIQITGNFSAQFHETELPTLFKIQNLNLGGISFAIIVNLFVIIVAIQLKKHRSMLINKIE